MSDQSTAISSTPTSSESSDSGLMPAEGPELGAPQAPADLPKEDDVQHSLSQEKRMRDFFASDAAALATDPSAAAVAATAAADVIAAETRDEQASNSTGEPLVISNPYKSNYRVFRIENPKAYYEAESLELRLPMIGAKSVDQLCKTIVMENTKHTGKPQS
ncbi:hypothetical protein Emag_002180 [Eimeria magna]